jgi:hypothetical protein
VLWAGALEAQSVEKLSAEALEGAWIRMEGINPAGVATPSPPAVRTFVDGYFSWMQAPANRVQPDSTATAAQLRAVWGAGVTARSGRYEVVGQTMTERPIAAKNPIDMLPSSFATFAIRLVADTMWITQIVNDAGIVLNTGTGKYVRMR